MEASEHFDVVSYTSLIGWPPPLGSEILVTIGISDLIVGLSCVSDTLLALLSVDVLAGRYVVVVSCAHVATWFIFAIEKIVIQHLLRVLHDFLLTSLLPETNF